MGDYAEPYCALYPAYSAFKHLASTLPTLWSHELEGLSETELWNHFDGMLYSHRGNTPLDDDRTAARCGSHWDRWVHHNFLTNWGEQFDDDGKSFILCPPGGGVLILNRSLPPKFGLALHAPLDAVLTAIHQFCEWFEKEASRLGIPVED